TTFVCTYGIPTEEMKQPVVVYLATMKGSHSNSQKQCKVDIEIGRMVKWDNTMMVGNLAKYDALIGMPFMARKGGIIRCDEASTEFPKGKIKIHGEPTSALIQPAVSETRQADLMAEFEDISAEIVQETL